MLIIDLNKIPNSQKEPKPSSEMLRGYSKIWIYR